jgi:hypothetical protein
MFGRLYIGINVRIRKEFSCDKFYASSSTLVSFVRTLPIGEISWSLENFEVKLCTAVVSFIKGIFNYRDKKHFVLTELELDVVSLVRGGGACGSVVG